MKKINILESAMKHYQIVVSMVVIMMVLGIFGILNMPRNEFPEFTIRQGIVVGIYPGATSMEVEEQLTTKIEDYLFSYEEVKKEKTYSHSKEGLMIVYVELNDNVKNADKFWSKLRLGLQELKMELPAGVVALIGSNDFGDTAALLITMSSEKKSYRELEVALDDLKDEIRKISSVSKIKGYGTQKEEIYIYIKPEKLTEFNVKPSNILV
ncbi:MAG: efflux RND transporter permease subunit, partial [Lutibacter sp.]